MTPLWVGFVVFVCLLLWLDLGVFNRKSHVISTSEALFWTAFWVIVALLFGGFVYFGYEHHLLGLGLPPHQAMGGAEALQVYLAGFIAEKALSLDNIFVIALIFAYFAVPGELQHRTLFWGIIGAMIFRGIMIAIGAQLIARFEWTITAFGVLLLLTALKMLFMKHEGVHPDANPLVRFARRLFPVTSEFHGERFFVVAEDGRRAMTPLFLVLLVIESTDVVFAVDSIPAIFGITKDPFIVFTSNVFAILGLRSLFFVLAGMLRRFAYLKYSLVALLLLIAVKMILHWKLSAPAMLGSIVGILLAGVVASLLLPTRDAGEPEAEPAVPVETDVEPPAMPDA